MKFRDINVPADWQILFTQLVSLFPGAPGAKRKATTRRQARLPRKIKKKRKNYYELKDVAGLIATREGLPTYSVEWATRRQQLLREMLSGYFDPNTFTECNLDSEIWLQNNPVSNPDPNPGPYPYRDQANLPTIPIYDNGAPAVSPALYSGETIGGYFYDVALRWVRKTYSLKVPYVAGSFEPVIVRIDATIDIDADQRGSRPMMSFIMRAFGCAPGSPFIGTIIPPTDKPWSWYWRYKLPKTTAPFFHTVEARNIVASLHGRSREDEVGTINKFVLLLAPRPMFGHGNNNNTQVATSAVFDVKIYQHKPTVFAVWQAAGGGVVISPGGLILTISPALGNIAGLARASIGKSTGKWYWEYTMNTVGHPQSGVQDYNTPISDTGIGWYPESWGMQHTDIYCVPSGLTEKWHDLINTPFGAVAQPGDVISVLLDMDAGTLTYWNNGVAWPMMYTGLTGTLYPAAGGYQRICDEPASQTILTANFGQYPMIYTPPNGYNVGLHD